MIANRTNQSGSATGRTDTTKAAMPPRQEDIHQAIHDLGQHYRRLGAAWDRLLQEFEGGSK